MKDEAGKPSFRIRSALGGRRAYVVIVVAIALATIGGMAALWPRGEAPRIELFEGARLLKSSYSGEVLAINDYGECCQRLEVEVTDGPDEGNREKTDSVIEVTELRYEVGDSVRVAKYGGGHYTVVDFDRKPPLLWLALAFAVLVILFGRLRGALSLLGLAVSLLIILFFMVPAILHNSSPLAVALVGSMAVMLTTIPLAHGLGPKSLAAMTGIAVSLAVITVLAIVCVDVAHLTGSPSAEGWLLASRDGGINLQSVLIAGTVIGSLGVLDDVAISQASTVMALRGANPQQRFGELFSRAIEVGRDHVGATVNTLVLAYAGTSMITLLALSSAQFDLLDAVNLGAIASVAVATLVGSIGLICAVPITTAFAALLAENIPAEELAADQHLGHAH